MMNEDRRNLTGGFEAISRQSPARTDEDEQRHDLQPPAVNIVPPPIENRGTQDFEQSNYNNDKYGETASHRNTMQHPSGIRTEEPTPTKKDFSIKNILRPPNIRTSPKLRPKLSLNTAHSSNESDESASVLHSNNLSPISAVRTRSRLRRLSIDESSVSDEDLMDSSLRSARLLSYVGAEDMDEFQDIQKEFERGLSEEGSWLPQLNKNYSSGATIDDEEEILETRSNTAENEAGRTESQDSTFIEDPVNAISIGRSQVQNEISQFEGPFKDLKNDGETVKVSRVIGRRSKKVQKPLKLYGKSLGLISPTNPVRLKLAQILLNKYYSFAYFSLLNIFSAILVARTNNTGKSSTLYSFSQWEDYLIFIMCVIFSISDLTKVIAFGFWDDSQMFAAYDRPYVTLVEKFGLVRFRDFVKKEYGVTFLDYLIAFNNIKGGDDQRRVYKNRSDSETEFNKNSDGFDIPRAFMRSSWNRIDFTSTVSFWIGLLLSINEYDVNKGIRIFKSLSVLRILRLVDTNSIYSSVFRGLKTAMPQLINVGTMLVYFWILFGILGVQSFKGSFRRNCVWVNPDDPTETFSNDNQHCGGQLDPITLMPQAFVYEDGSIGPVSKGFLCPQYSKCVSGENPYNGRVSFDNVVAAMEMVFVVMSVNTFTDLMYDTMNTDSMGAALFFIVSIFILNIWLMNLLVAVLVSSFEIANGQFQKYASELRRKKNVIGRLKERFLGHIHKKATSSELSPWCSNCLHLYTKVEPLFVILIAIDLSLRCHISADVSQSYLEKFYKVDFSISAVLLFESCLRLFLHCSNLWIFLTKVRYLFDLNIAIMTFIISAVNLYGNMGRAYDWLSVLQIIRFYRLVCVFSFSSDLWKKILSNRRLVLDLSTFYFYFIFLVSIIFSLLFEGIVPSDLMSDVAFGMFSFPNTFLSLYVIGTTENWTSTLYSLQEYSPNISSAFFASVFTITWFILSNFVIMNIFIAVIAATMDVDENEKRPLQIKHYLKYVYPRKIREYTQATLIDRIKKKLFNSDVRDDSKDFKHFLIRGSAIMNLAQNTPELTEELQKERRSEEEQKLAAVFFKLIESFSFLRKLKIYANNPFYKKPEIVFTETDEGDQRAVALQLDDHEAEKIEYLRLHPSYNYAYFVIPPHHAFRKFCQRLVPPSVGKRTDGVRFYDDDTNLYGQRVHFNRVERDLFLLLITCATLILIVVSCLYTPLYRFENKDKTWDWFTYWECAFVCIFTLEFVVKTVADGVIYTPNAYLRNPWNYIDLFVLTSLWINFVAFLENEGDLSRIFKGLTALRALRLLTISSMARETFNLVVFDGSRKILAAGFLSMTLLFPFCLWGLSLFRGRLGTCNDGNMDRNQCYNEFTQTVFQWDVMSPRAYSQPYLYFDTFSSSLRTLYEIVSLEGWTDLLTNIMNSTGVGTVASAFSSAGDAAFLILFNFLSMIFILNVFVSFIISNHSKTTGTAYLTIEEKSWFEAKKLLTQARPKRTPEVKDYTKIRKFFYRLASQKKYFYYVAFIQVVLYIHIVVLLCRTYRTSSSARRAQDIYFMFSTSIFLLQELFRIYGEGFFFFMRSRWSPLRFAVVLVSFILTAISLKLRNEALPFYNIDGLFHLTYFLFLIPQNNTLSELIQTAAASWPSIFSLTYTWAILFLAYAIALNQVFGLTRLGPNTTNNINFRTIIKSLIVLFRCSFGEGWNYIMADLTVNEPFCSSSSNSGYSDCGSKTYAYLLLMSWNILSMYIFLNMFISVVITNFSYVYRRGGSKSPIDRKEILKYIDAWAKFDRFGRGKISFSDLTKLMHCFEGPLSFKIWEGSFTIRQLVNNYMEVNPEDPYDVKVDLAGLNRHLDTIDRDKIVKRRLQYRRFIQQVRFTNNYADIVSFSNLIELTPLYTTYVPRECLGIDEYMRNLYYTGKVDKFLRNERNVDVLNMVVTAWKYRSRKAKKEMKVVAQNEQITQNSYNQDLETSSKDMNLLNTPLMDYGVNMFMWSPRTHTINPEGLQGSSSEEE